MKRLEIVLIGHSLTLSELNNELQAHGHGVQHLTDPSGLQNWNPGDASILIEDGSLELHGAQLTTRGQTDHLSLRVGINPTASALPQLELLCWHGSARALRLIECQRLPSQASGNGRELRDEAVAALIDMVALQISRLSRDTLYFESLATAQPSQSERQEGLLAVDQLLFEHHLNRTQQPHLLQISETPVIDRLVRALELFADRPALTLDGQTYSYAELHAHSDAILQHLAPLIEERVASCAPAVIGICLPKSMALYAGILAILRSGAVYLPLDPGQPLQRQQYILENSGALLLLHDGAHLLAIAEFPALDISAMPASGAAPPRAVIQPEPDAPCMALYTSGTTGHPKGVMLSQRNLSHFTAWYAEYVSLKETSRVLQFSTLSFDSSLIDIFPTWLSGAELVVPDEDQRRDPLQLVNVLKQGISHAFLPPALLSIMPLDQPLGLEHVMTGGDVCEPHVIAQLTRQCHFHNLYGPTETTVLVTAGEFESHSSNRDLGRPIANSQVWILDDQGLPVAEQTQGELYICGPGVSLGYINNPELTSERYVWLERPDGQQLRAYRTGDMGKWTANGIELSGRRDNQVKIRGFRVEPEEIEHCLRASQLYRQVAVVVNAERRILAFLAQPHEEQNAETSQQALREHVQRLLPDYMQPAAYMTVEYMPYAGNGKIDRKALLEIPVSFADQHPRRLPETEQEHQLVELWAQLLELPANDISTDESFFNLGGHSILLSRMLLGIREQFGRSIPINRFIEAPTLLTLAGLIDSDSDACAYTISPQALEDAHAPLTLPTLPISKLGDVHKVIVTGANGFLGVHIVQALLAWGATEIACLVREGSGQSAQERFEQSLKENRLSHLDLRRVTVYSADVSLPKLGLSDEVYERLDRDFGALVHNAANVNHVQDYETLVKDNVAPVLECLKLCEGRSKKIFNFVSTLSASSAVDAAGNVLEQPAADTPPIYIKNGYNLSKWVAERILQRAREQGAWVNIYRPGNIAFNSSTGVCQPQKNRLMLMLKGSLQLGLVPEFAMTFDLMPVDFLARFIGFHASRYQPERAVFNLHNPEPLSWNSYVEAFRDSGRQFEMVSVAHWQTQLDRVDSQNALFGVLGFYLNGFEEDIGDISMIEYQNAHAGIRHMGEQYPKKTPALLRKGCDYLKEIDFI
ncbi:non-ribosomal peptide synthetase [Pseudomonas sp. CDFA 602]|uniref:non-ribosomal peptide synthetase n=1 Tax=Pseudomonas californiensis TaxID=2829823 RepID=UPI001E5C5C2D|nr:non-ribosomal peptide synthetase [Pseudomonas californiensis]MCD5997271.1 non-ribosomal peptide synthetase [Pseudomonas californiensis]MCD6002872.1 non-ribosomal peptide synthetase [Pseudomonas californiensis]